MKLPRGKQGYEVAERKARNEVAERKARKCFNNVNGTRRDHGSTVCSFSWQIVTHFLYQLTI